MKREIKFRAWDTLNKIMLELYGFIKTVELDESVYIVQGPEIDDTIICDDLIIMQYTGLKDKNGKEIYEGDIISGDFFNEKFKTMGEVIYSEHFCFYASKNLSGETPLFKINRIEIIGNIHENPELLPSTK